MSAVFPLKLDGLLPIPLRERIEVRRSEIWQQRLAWNATERVFVQAPSGTGKTTLIHILYGLRKDFEGAVTWGSTVFFENVDAEQVSSMRKQQVSVIFQDMRLFPALTARENLEIKRVLSNTVTTEEVHDMMDTLGIADRADRPASTLSYGEQQRVAIIRALLQPFSWLLMDEPFSHLDAANTARAAKLIDRVVAKNGASFLLADLDDNDHFSYTQKLRL
jgi:putative ABC transport system ATP-binding protein